MTILKALKNLIYKFSGEESAAKTISAAINEIEAPPSGLPAVTAADNGKILTVSNGAWNKGNIPTPATEYKMFTIATPDGGNTPVIQGFTIDDFASARTGKMFPTFLTAVSSNEANLTIASIFKDDVELGFVITMANNDQYLYDATDQVFKKQSAK